MKGYAFLDNEGNIGFRVGDYIDNINPGFWQDNIYLIIKTWSFDTENMSTMYSMYSQFRSMKLKSQAVLEFSSLINFDPGKLSTYASSLQ